MSNFCDNKTCDVIISILFMLMLSFGIVGLLLIIVTTGKERIVGIVFIGVSVCYIVGLAIYFKCWSENNTENNTEVIETESSIV